MTENSATKVKVGATVLVAVVILLYGISFLKSCKVGVKSKELTVYFNDVYGLKEGDQVSVNGVPKGKVEKIELISDSVQVKFLLSNDVVLKKDYSASVSMIELMSGKQIAISPGKSDTLADITKPLIGSKSQDVVSLIETMNTIGEDVKVITSKLNTTTDNLNKTILNVNEIVSDEGLKSNLRGTASNFNTASKQLNLLLSENRTNLSQLTSKLNLIANNVDNTVTETRPELKESLSNIKTMTSKIDSLTLNLNALILNARDSNSTVGKLLTQDEFYTSMNKTIGNINKLLKDINKHIKKNGIKISIF